MSLLSLWGLLRYFFILCALVRDVYVIKLLNAEFSSEYQRVMLQRRHDNKIVGFCISHIEHLCVRLNLQNATL